MRKAILLLLVLIGVQMAAQEASTVTVKNSEQSNGVVILTATQAATADQAKVSFALHCNKGASGCKALEPGTYLMVRLPKNWGMYDCANVDLYPTSADPAKDQKLGEYCLNEK